MNTIPRQDGFTLLEVLIAMIIIAVGLLGIAALQSHAYRAETESYQRAQALVLLNDMAGRIPNNRNAAGCYALGLDGSNNPIYVGTGYTGPYQCTSYGVPETQQIVTQDMSDWNAMLQGAAETKGAGGPNIGGIIGARGCVTTDATGTLFTVSVAWQGLSQSIEPTDPCGSGLYGPPGGAPAPGWRRVVYTQVRIF